MAVRGRQARWVVCIIIYIVSQQETSALTPYTLATGNGKDPLIVSHDHIYLQLGETHRIPCQKKQTGGTPTDVIVATWDKERVSGKREDIIRTVSDSIHGENYTAPEYEGRASLTPDYDLTLKNVNDGDSGRYKCDIIAHSSEHNVDYDVEVTVIDDKLPKRPMDKSVSMLLKAGENIIHCPVYNKSLTRPTVYWSIQREGPTDIVGARFSDGVILRKDPTFDIQQVANYSLVTTYPKAVPEELLVWCHVSSDVDGVNLMSGFINATRQPKPAEISKLEWIIPLACVGVVFIIIIVCAVNKYVQQPQNQTSGTPEETSSIIQGPINTESCKDYRLKAVIRARKEKETTCFTCCTCGICGTCWEKDFSSLKLVTVAGGGDVVLLDGKAIHVVSKKYDHKDRYDKWASSMDEYVAIATAKKGEVLVARKTGKISWLTIGDMKEKKIAVSREDTPGQISDMDVDDMGTIYVADVEKNKIFTYFPEGSFKSSFVVSGSPKCISACEEGILYVLSETKSDKGSEFDLVTIKKFTNTTREDYDIKCPTGMNIVATRLYSNKTFLFVVNKSERSAEEASEILQFSAADGHYQRRIIEDWHGIVGMVIIRGHNELAFFDSKQVKVYERKNSEKS